METLRAFLRWKLGWIFAFTGIIAAAPLSHADNAGQKAVEEIRQTLRQQGFKTDLGDFNFSTSPELRAREAILKTTASDRRSEPFVNHPNLMEAVGTNSAIVVWKLDGLKKLYHSWPDNSEELTWDEFREAVNVNHAQIETACAAILSGPIAFNLNASEGNYMLLPHLSLLKNLMEIFGDRTLLALHDGNKDTAWTNLMAATRLVTAWQTEPAEVSYRARFGNASLAFNTIWQAIQTNGWRDEQLARLQQEWESVDFFTNLPEIMAFNRASQAAGCQRERQDPRPRNFTFVEFFEDFLHSPFRGWQDLKHNYSQRQYREVGTYEDEKNLLLFYRDRELELRKAIQASTWSAMRQLPGVTNLNLFKSQYRSRMQTSMNLKQIGMSFQDWASSDTSSLLGRAAKAEAQRRLIITAIALERYRGKHGSYPKALSELAPEFLKVVPVDFMDGLPLRYRLTEDGHFILYSVGLDCVDNGGKIYQPMSDVDYERLNHPGRSPRQSDIVWPLPATFAAVQDLHRQETRARELEQFLQQQRWSEGEWKKSPLRQSRVAKILAMKWDPVLSDEFFGGRPAAGFLRNTASTSNRLSLAGLMTPRQVFTGNEPEEFTFQFPINYDVITNQGFLLLLDADMKPGSLFAPDSGAEIQERKRAPNGDCLLVWHTIFDPPGQHALQTELVWHNEKGAEMWCRGPASSVVTSNLCQFSLASAHFDQELGADFQARLPEKNGRYIIELNTTNGTLLKTITGSTSNGIIKVHWDLIDDRGQRFTNVFFNSVFYITLPDSGRTQTLKGP